MIATFQQPDQTADNPGIYFPKNDGNWKVAQPIIGAFAAHEAATPNMTVLIDAGAIGFMGQVPTIVGQQTSATITAPVSNPRNDIVVIDMASGVYSIAAGAEAAVPLDPAIPEGKIAVARLALTIATTTITNAIITDLRTPVLAVQGSPGTISINTNTTLTQKQAGRTVYCSGAGTAITLPSPVGCTGARFVFVGADSNSQTISGSLVYPIGASTSLHTITNTEVIEFEANNSAWHVVSMAGRTYVKSAATGSDMPIPRIQADTLYLAAASAFGGDVTGTYGALSLIASGVGAGTYGSATAVPVITVDAKGRVTGVSTVSVAAGVATFNGRGGAVSLTTGDVTGALGMNPADHGAYAVGALCLCTLAGGSPAYPGTVVSGASLSPTNAFSDYYTSLSGSWRCLGYSSGGGSGSPSSVTLFQRIS